MNFRLNLLLFTLITLSTTEASRRHRQRSIDSYSDDYESNFRSEAVVGESKVQWKSSEPTKDSILIGKMSPTLINELSDYLYLLWKATPVKGALPVRSTPLRTTTSTSHADAAVLDFVDIEAFDDKEVNFKTKTTLTDTSKSTTAGTTTMTATVPSTTSKAIVTTLMRSAKSTSVPIVLPLLRKPPGSPKLVWRGFSRRQTSYRNNRKTHKKHFSSEKIVHRKYVGRS